MFYSLLSGLRSIRVSLVTGGIIVVSTYVLTYGLFFERILIRPVLLSLLAYSYYVPIILVLCISLMVGSLYTTLLEGIVDDLHRKYVSTEIELNNFNIRSTVVRSLLPYSDSAIKRLKEEVGSFYKEHHFPEDNDDTESETKFINKVLVEILWMEGKIVGTPLEQSYDKIRSEGEMRVAAGLVLPYACTAISYSLYATDLQIIFSFFGGILVSIPIVNYGLYYFKKANSFLAHHIADGKVLAPSMESLKRSSDRRCLDITNQQTRLSD